MIQYKNTQDTTPYKDCKINKEYIIQVADHQPVPLPKPRKKKMEKFPAIRLSSGEDP